jgi:hypothetical protein
MLAHDVEAAAAASRSGDGYRSAQTACSRALILEHVSDDHGA